VLGTYISSDCSWVPEHCYVKVGLSASDSSGEPTSWEQTNSCGGKCQLGFSQSFILYVTALLWNCGRMLMTCLGVAVPT
jgi:hypothetical protein